MKLIPVIEIAYCNQGIEPPSVYPRWEHREEWDAYRAATHKKAGFASPMPPYREGEFLFECGHVCDENLRKLVEDHMPVDGTATCPLFGGYILELGGKPLLYPQCCGDLSDLRFWAEVASGKPDPYWNGHPGPQVTYENDRATFACLDDYEDFQGVAISLFTLSRSQLGIAVSNAENQLRKFEQRIAALLENLGLPRVARELTFGDSP